jgi:hypothetical protein
MIRVVVEAEVHNADTYNNKGCRCGPCTQDNALQTANTRAKRREYVAQYGLPGHVKHGASAYTNWGCKCDACRAEHAVEVARYRR